MRRCLQQCCRVSQLTVTSVRHVNHKNGKQPHSRGGTLIPTPRINAELSEEPPAEPRWSRRPLPLCDSSMPAFLYFANLGIRTFQPPAPLRKAVFPVSWEVLGLLGSRTTVKRCAMSGLTLNICKTRLLYLINEFSFYS